MLVVGGLITWFHSRRGERQLAYYFVQPTLDEEAENESILKRINISPIVGISLVVLWLCTLGSVVGLRATGAIPDDSTLALFEIFFRIGSII